MRRAANLVVLSLAWCLAGCPPSEGWPGAASRPTADTLPATPSAAESPPDVLLVQVRILGIEVPAGMASGSEDIWSYVDEESVLAGSSAMGHNGFRVGLVRRDHWSSLERILRQLTGRQAKDMVLSTMSNFPIPIALKERQPAQTLFVYRPDRTLRGEDYPPADNLLTFLMALNEEEPNQVLVLGQPQLRATDEATWVLEETRGYGWVSRPKIYDLPDLTFRVSAPSGDIIVVGPGAAARRPNSVAHRFLVKERDGMEFETVLLVVPSVVRASGRVVPAPVAGASPPPPGPS